MSPKKRKKQEVDHRQPYLPFSEQSDNGAIPEKARLKIGGNTGPDRKYFEYDKQGNIILPDSFDLTDDWWGLSFRRYPDQPVIVGRTPVMLEIFNKVVTAADSELLVAIQGETGTGKELIARALASPKGGPFKVLNCAALTETLLESELFGHVKGAFTGATADRKGWFERADKGTLLLDEIGDMPLKMQAKLLRVIEDGVVIPVGSTRAIIVDVWVICATNKNLLSLMMKGKFRKDFYYRINTVQINLPTLGERKEDIPLLTVYFLLKNRSYRARKVSMISSKTLEKSHAYGWPGNIRQLANAIKAALLLGEGPVLWPDEFDFDTLSLSDTGLPSLPSRQTNKKGPAGHFQRSEEELRELLRLNPGATVKELACSMHWSERAVQRRLDRLIYDAMVTRQKDERDGRIKRYYLANGSDLIG